MIKHKDHFHGSDLEAIEKCYHIKKEDIISFSANVVIHRVSIIAIGARFGGGLAD